MFWINLRYCFLVKDGTLQGKDRVLFSGGISLSICQFLVIGNDKKLRTGCCFRWYFAYLSILGEMECQKVKDGMLFQVVFRYLLVNSRRNGMPKLRTGMLFQVVFHYLLVNSRRNRTAKS